MLMRAELNAWGYLFIEKGLITREEFNTRFDIECDLLSKDYEKKFPGFKAWDYGMTMEPPHIATGTMSGWTK